MTKYLKKKETNSIKTMKHLKIFHSKSVIIIIICLIVIGWLIVGILENVTTIHTMQQSSYQLEKLRYNDVTTNMNTTLLSSPSNLSIVSTTTRKIKNNTTSTSTLSSSKSLSLSSINTLSSPACKPFQNHFLKTKIKRIFIYHFRKAGGTTIITYFKKVAKKYNITIRRVEGAYAEQPKRNDTFYITFMRDPIQRSISHYKYDFRWSCSNLTKMEPKNNKKMEKINNNNNNVTYFIPTIQNSKIFKEFISRDTHFASEKPCKYRNYLWTCSINCYIRWLSFPLSLCEDTTLKNVTKSYNIAYNKLKNYDLIINSDKLFIKNTNYVQTIEIFFGMKGLSGSHLNAQCDTESKIANNLYPLTIDNETMDILRTKNEMDYKLYNEFIVPCHNNNNESNNIIFPNNFKTFSDYL